MAHFCELDENNNVLRVLVVDNAKITNEDGDEVEQMGIDFLKNLFGENTIWKKTSYNTVANTHKLDGTPFRYNYASVGGTYDPDNDAFINAQPFPSWILDQNFDWQPPIPYPEDQHTVGYYWDEDLYQSDNSQGWIASQ